MPIITASKKNKEMEQFITITRKEYNELIALKKSIHAFPKETMEEKHILRLSREAKKLKMINKLPLLQSLRSLR